MDLLRLTAWPFLLAAIISLVITPLVIYFYRQFGWVVGKNKTIHPAHIHEGLIPKGGGIPLLLGTIIPAFLFLPHDRHFVAIIFACILLVAVGVWDDIKDVNPYIRLGVNFAAALIVIIAGIGIPFITNPFTHGIITLNQPQFTFDFWGSTHSIWILADLFALLWIPFVINAINFSSGLDGQISGVVLIAALTIGFLSFNYSADVTQWPVAVLAFALAGAFAGYLPFSMYPQKTMPGYGGTSLAGFLLATLAILSTTKVGTAWVVLGVPFIDAIYVGLRRLATGRSPLKGDRGHLHHRLLDLGWSKRQIAFFYWTITAILGFVALKLQPLQKFYTIVLVGLILGIFLLWISFGHSSVPSDHDNG